MREIFHVTKFGNIREAAENLLLMAGPLRPNPPPPELNGRFNFLLQR